MQVWRWTEAVPDLMEPGPGDRRLLAGLSEPVQELGPGAEAVPDPGDLVLCGACSSALDVAWYLGERGWMPCKTSVLCTTQWSGRGQMR
ncbi:MAG TPA: hypothetical protein VJ934_10025, partial [Desulfomicrobiaceae bacterium]|nr:hypothetical protein [Desulfomicrobiaceae bacterium]